MITKFRVWFSEASQMITDGLESINFFDETVTITTGYYDSFADEYIFDSMQVAIGNAILMQSTGLIDKNGVEIYEGDIIGWRYVITYVDSSQPGNLGMSIGFYAQRDDFESYHMLDVGDEYEVLGNVYENPELLEVE